MSDRLETSGPDKLKMQVPENVPRLAPFLLSYLSIPVAHNKCKCFRDIESFYTAEHSTEIP